MKKSVAFILAMIMVCSLFTVVFAEDFGIVENIEYLITLLPEPEEVTVDDALAIEEAAEKYDGLTETQKELVSEPDYLKLQAVKAALKVALDQDAAARVEAMINALPTPTDITLEDMSDILEADDAYNGLTSEQQALVNEQSVEKLTQILAQMEIWGEYTMGDVTKDGKVDAKDALIALKIAVKKVTPTYIESIVADADANLTVDAKDALEMLKFSVKKPSVLDQYYVPPIL